MNKTLKAFNEASDVRKFEIGLFWQRALFFWGFIASALIAFAELSTEKVPNHDLLLIIGAFGTICSVAWALANRGSKYWQENWEAKLKNIENEILGKALYADNYKIKEPAWWGAGRYSVSRLTIALSDCTVWLWTFLYLRTLIQLGTSPLDLIEGTFITLFVIYYIFALLSRCQSRNL